MEYKRLTPNLVYENALIGACLNCKKSEDVIPTIVSKIKDIDPFYQKKNNDIWRAILELYNANSLIDLVTVTAMMESMKLPCDPNDMDDKIELIDGSPVSEGIIASYYVDLFLWEMRWIKAQKIQMQIQEKLSSYDKDFDGIKELYQEGINELETIDISIHSASDDMSSLLRSINVDVPIFYDTGFADLDRIIDGLYDTEFAIIAGRPSMGKTSFALSCAMNMALKDNVMFISYEMNREMLLAKILSSASGIDCSSVKRKYVEDDNIPKLIMGASKINDALKHLSIEDSISTVYNDLADVIINSCRMRKIKIFFIDYFGYLHDNRYGDNRQQELSFISSKLKRLAMDNKIVIILLSQMNRGNESRADKRPLLADLRDTGSLEQDADLVMMLYREDYQQEENANSVLEVIVRKNKNGATGTAKLFWDRRIQKYGNLARGI